MEELAPLIGAESWLTFELACSFVIIIGEILIVLVTVRAQPWRSWRP